VRARIKGIGTVAAVEDWSTNQFTAEAGAGTITKVNVAILRASSATGNWQAAKGSTVPLTYGDLLTLIAGGSGDIAQIDVGDGAVAGSTGKYADAGHQHALPAPAAPALVDKSAAAAGASATVARADHKHDIATAAPGAAGLGTASGEGSSANLARADHTHQSNTAASAIISGAGTVGTSTEPARADHQHQHPAFASGDLHSEYSKADGSRAFTNSIQTAGQKLAVAAKSADYTLTNTDEYVEFDATAAARTATLPAATGSGRKFIIAKIDAGVNTVTIDAAGAETINGVATKLINIQHECYTLVDRASGAWIIVA
jgi:hypothetical protein